VSVGFWIWCFSVRSAACIESAKASVNTGDLQHLALLCRMVLKWPEKIRNPMLYPFELRAHLDDVSRW